MKNLFFIVLFIGSQAFNAQKLSDYKYVYVPQNFKGFENNKYGLNSMVVKKLQSKGYEVIQNDQSFWPEELRQNPCEVAFINILDTGNFFKNKMTFEVKDCHEKVIVSQQGISSEKDFDKGYKEAVQRSIMSIPTSEPIKDIPTFKSSSENSDATNKETKIIAQTSNNQVVSSQQISSSSSNNFTNGKVDLHKVLIGKGKFILVSQNSSVPYATFTESTKRDIFHVVLENGSVTLGYLENGNYVIEMPNMDGSFRKEIFTKK